MTQAIRSAVAVVSLGAIAYGCYLAWAPLAWIVTGGLVLGGLVFAHVTGRIAEEPEGATDA